MPLHILIADDHPMFRRGLRSLLETQNDLSVVGETASAAETLGAVEKLIPNVVLMDLHMPGGGLSVTRELAQRFSSVRVLVVTMFKDDDSVFTALRAGAKGYVLKDASADDLLRAIRAVGRGEAIFSSEIATRVLTYFSRPRSALPNAFPELTARELEVLGFIAEGRGNPEIARLLELQLKTVANYASSIFSKLQVADRAEATVRAREAGLGAQDNT